MLNVVNVVPEVNMRIPRACTPPNSREVSPELDLNLNLDLDLGELDGPCSSSSDALRVEIVG